MLTFNEFQRQIKNRGIDPQTAYMFTLMFEYIIELNKQGDEQASLMLNLFEQMQRVVELNKSTLDLANKVKRQGKPEGVEVASVAYDPDERKH